MTEINHFLRAFQFIMIPTGQWNYRGKKSRLISFHKKIKYFPLCYYISASIIFLSSIIPNWKCKTIVFENFFNGMHLVVVSVITLLLKSKGTTAIMDFIYHYENEQIKRESAVCLDIYMKMSKRVNRLVIFFVCIAAFASSSWFVTGRK